MYPLSIYYNSCNFIIGNFVCKHPLFCEGLSIHFPEINIQNIGVVYRKAVILHGDYPLKKAVMRVRAVKATLYAYKNLTFKLTKSRGGNIQKTLRFKTNSKLKYMVVNLITKQK